jgi:ABC-type dipeptide/oligopeptide/nickel transport system permease subunit
MKAPLARAPARAALLFLALLVLLATFADLIACGGPLIGSEDGKLRLFSPSASTGSWQWKLEPLVGASPSLPSSSGPSSPPSAAHWLGTDAEGVDVLARTIHGARSSVLVTLAVLSVALALGLLGGLVAGMGPPIADALLARAVELTGALPTLVVLAIVRTVEVVPSVVSFVAVIAVFRAVRIARLVRGEVLRVAAQDYVLASRALGSPPWRVAARHMLPHVMGPVLVAATFTAASVVALEAALSFVGLGLPSDLPTWGGLLGQAGDVSQPAAVVAPALAIVTTTAAAWLLADALDDSLSARRGRSRT